MSLSILTVTHFFESHRGGIELVAGRMQRELAALGHDVRWAASAADPSPNDGVIEPTALRTFDPLEKLTGLPMPIPFPGSIVQLFSAVKSSDAVIIHDALYATSILAMLAAKYYRKRTLLVQHIGSIPFSSRILRALLALANRLVAQPMLRGADSLVFISDTVRRHFGAIKRNEVSALIFNGVDHARFRLPSLDEREAARRLFKIDGGQKNLLFIGRFVEKKGLSILRHIAALQQDVTFHLVGSGPIDPTAWGLVNVRVHGMQAPDAVAALLQAVDGLILPSTGEGYPLVVQEALACGLPVYCGEESCLADPEAAAFLFGCPVDLAEPEESAIAFVRTLTAHPPDGPQRARSDFARARYDWTDNARRIAVMLEAGSPRVPAAA